MLIFKTVLNDWKIITVSNIERKYKPCREINKIKRFLKQVKLAKNITFNNIKSMKIFRITILSLKYVEKCRRTRNNLKIKVFITNRGFCRQTFAGLTGLLWQSLLKQTDLLAQTLLGRTGLLGQTLTGRTGLLEKTELAQAGLLKLIYIYIYIYF